MKIIDQLDLSEANFEGYQLANSDENKIELSKLNICIGENNSGKSRFIRSLFDFDSFGKFNSNKLVLIEKYINECNETYDHALNYFTKTQNPILENRNFLYIKKNNENIQKFSTPPINKKKLENCIEWFVNQINSLSELNKTSHLKDLRTLEIESREVYKELSAQNNNKLLEIKYIHTLRSVYQINEEKANERYSITDNKDIFKKAVLDIYSTNIKGFNEVEIITGQDFYIKFRDLSHKTDKERIKKKRFEKYLSTTFFNNNELEITASIEGDILIKIGNNEHPINQIGDGINAIICLLYTLFLEADKDQLILIEEPETNLHPGMQRILIEALMNKDYFPNFQYFITTHSNHFLDLAFEYPEDISILHFQKKVEDNKEYFEINPTTANNIKVLDSLGVRNSSVFLSNCTIWVEGITDRLYLKKYLELYQKTKDQIFHEDLHYSFLEYAGTNVKHYDFTDNKDIDFDKIKSMYISNKILLITDSDNAEEEGKKDKNELHQRLEAELKDNFIRLPVTEIENTLTVEIVTEALKISDSGGHKIKLKNGHNDIKSMRLGSFIENNYTGLNRTYANTESNNKIQTISSTYKTEFCKAACKVMNSYEELSQEAKELTERVYKFIEEHNRK